MVGISKGLTLVFFKSIPQENNDVLESLWQSHKAEDTPRQLGLCSIEIGFAQQAQLH